ncbi:MAG: MltA domain-containing protein, partial [Helicobacteraceae bacterium]|nr:MltA domain-containing protein [Helicobacteraceae bacterium]
MKKVLFCVVAMFLLCGCVAVSPVLDVSLTPQFAETFPKSNRQSAIYRPVSWKALKNWTRDDHSEALSAFAKSCESMRDDLRWKKVCAEARALNGDDTIGARIFFETHFQPYEMISDGEKAEGLITGYYLPLLKGSRTQTARYKYPIYKKPSDLVQINLRAFGIEHKSIRGRLLSDGKVVPYY